MASITTTARGRMQTSCLPLTAKSAFSSVFMLTVLWFRAIEAIGLTATRKTTGMPLLIPPSMPPALLVSVDIRPSVTIKGSLFSEPLLAAAENPAPNSTPLTAGIASMALASAPSRESKTGSPRPTGTLRAIPSITPPRLSPSALACSISLSISDDAAGSAQPRGLPATFPFSLSKSTGAAFTPPISTVWASTSIFFRRSSFRASTPAITQPAVILPENRPLPRKSLKPPDFT